MIVTADSSPLMTLAHIGRIDLLPRLYKTVVISPEMYSEVAVSGAGLAGSGEIANAPWIEVKAISRTGDLDAARSRFNLGLGELSLIVLSKAIRAALALVDDKQARKLG